MSLIEFVVQNQHLDYCRLQGVRIVTSFCRAWTGIQRTFYLPTVSSREVQATGATYSY